jgi:hypothetical protein
MREMNDGEQWGVADHFHEKAVSRRVKEAPGNATHPRPRYAGL